MKNTRETKFSIDVVWKTLLTLILLFYGLTQASSILIPIVFSLFLAVILTPVVESFEKRGFNSVLSILFTLIIVSLTVGGGIFYVSTQAKNLISDLPDLVDKLNVFINQLTKTISQNFGFSFEEQIDLVKKNSDKLLSSGSSIFTNALSVTSNVVSFLTLMPIYVFFILLYRKNFKNFIGQFDKRNGNKNWLEMGSEVKAMVHSYISGMLIVITIIAVLNTIGLLSLGLKYAVFMGVLSAVLTVIPYIGIFIGGALPVVVALLTKDSLFYPLGVVAIFAFVQFIEGNLITPNVIGSKVNVNPLAAIIALIIGGKIWGIVGMIIAIPICGIMKIIFSHFERLRPFALLLSSSNDGPDIIPELNLKQKIKSFVKKSKS